MLATEATPLTANGSPIASTAGNRQGQVYAFCFGIVISSFLVGAYYLGTLSSSSHYDRYTNNEKHRQHSSVMRMKTTNIEGTTPSSFKYISTQFISFTINTLGGLEDHGECDGRNVDPRGVCYLGDAQNITHDVQHRLQIVKYVLTRIKNDSFQESPDIDHLDNVLKIVAMPEFFWRGPNGAYTVLELKTLYGHVADELRKMISDDFFSDFLFCFGTIVAARSASDPRESRQKHLHATQVEYFNFSPVIVGGPESRSFVVTKKYISGADFLSRTTLPNPAEEDVHDYADFDEDLTALFLARNTSIVHDNVIELDGLRIGIEICLDHRLGVLWNDLLSRHHSDLVDVLLITSAGMAIERGPNPVVPGGVIYLSDGGASSAACIRPIEKGVSFHPNQVCRGEMSIIGLKHIPLGQPG
jgi:hypothetical protein